MYLNFVSFVDNDIENPKNQKHRTTQNHVIRETVHLAEGKLSIFFSLMETYLFFLGGNIYGSHEILN